MKHNIYVMRHGQSISNVDKIIISSMKLHHKAPLTPLGIQQAKDSCLNFNFPSPLTVISSPFLRARQTAETVCSELNIPSSKIQYDTRLSERFFGDFDGLSSSHYEECWVKDKIDPNHKFKNCESVSEVSKRTLELTKELKARDETHYLLVSHCDALMILEATLNKQPLSTFLDIPYIKNAEIRKLTL